MQRRTAAISVLAAAFIFGVCSTALAQHEGHDHGDAEASHAKAEQKAEQATAKTDEKADAAKLPNCPVMGETIDFSVKADTDDGPVYFCCEMCIKKFESSPATYAETVAAQRKLLKKLDRVQVTCPLSGQAINAKMFVEKDGKKVAFCCADCKGSYAKDPAKYAGALEGSYTYQAKCPVTGGEIDPAEYADLPTGQRVYYCSADCDKKFKADPAKYVEALKKQGTNVNAKQLVAAMKKEKP